jgi:hypothetical protein
MKPHFGSSTVSRVENTGRLETLRLPSHDGVALIGQGSGLIWLPLLFDLWLTANIRSNDGLFLKTFNGGTVPK